MYGLPQGGKLAYNQLVQKLDPHGYAPCRHTLGLWCHKWRLIIFPLVFNDFGVKYVSWDHAKHLVNTLLQYHTLKMDWAGTFYCVITLTWDHTRHTVDLNMPGYINADLLNYQHPEPCKSQHAPYLWYKTQYGQTTQYAKPADNSPKLYADGIKHIQKFIGTLLYNSRAIVSTMLMVINAISAAQAHGTTVTAAAVAWLLDYVATNPDATVR